MSADLLRRAAKVLREHAERATPGPWTVKPIDGRSVLAPTRMVVAAVAARELWPVAEDAQFVALMHPPVALILAEWLEVQAIFIEQRSARGLGVERGAGPVHHANAVARAILREAP